ncbi:MAG TPA: RNA 2',3'-cyclic phosphodiesterase [Candidatus Omnitrophica bacterium]|nr:RNA 2',3'-cyclic phosphodiesterase [Candidatus Omnitrophota bacterium]
MITNLSENIRTFIAANINDTILNEIGKAQEHLENIDCDVKWVKTTNVHLTLKFLGEIEQKRVPKIVEKLEFLTKHIRSIRTQLSQLGAFPKIEKPKVIWIGLEDNSNEIADLVEAIDNTLTKEGFKKEEHSFKPHVTIGRIRSLKNISALANALKIYSLPQSIYQEITEIKLIKSILTPKGPIYEDLKAFKLQ